MELNKQPKWIALSAVLVVASSVTLAGCGKGQNKNIRIDGVKGPTVNFVDNKLLLNLTLEGLAIDFGTRIPIPNLDASVIEIGPDLQSDGYLISVALDVKDVQKLSKNAIGFANPVALPGGRPLPGVAEGQLPAVAVTLPKKGDDIVVYAGPTVIGVFVPVKLPWKDYMGTFRFYDGAGDRIGNLSIVGQDQNGANSGVLILVSLNGKVGKLVGLP